MQHAVAKMFKLRHMIAYIAAALGCTSIVTCTAAHVPRSLMQAQGRGIAAAAAANTTAQSAAPHVEHLLLQHSPPTWRLNATSSQSETSVSTSVPVNFSIYYPAKGSSTQQQQQQQQSRLPVMFLLNGANVEAGQYSTLAGLLNGRGYVFVASDYYQPLPKAQQGHPFSTDPLSNWTRPTTCPSDKMLAPSAALTQTFLNHVKSQQPQNPALGNLDSRGIVLVAHSYGGGVTAEILSGQCSASGQDSGGDMVSICEGYQPSLWNSSCTVGTGGPASDSSSSSCSSSSGGGSSCGCARKGQGLIRGAVVYEGYKTALGAAADARNSAALVMGSSVYLPIGVNVPPGMFVLYLSSQFSAPKVQRAYESTNESTCSCGAEAVFVGLNHYGICNYQPNTTMQGIRQVTPCGHPSSSDPVNFRVTEAQQNKQLQNMARLIDDCIKAWMFDDAEARQQLLQLAAAGSSNSSSSNRDFRLQLKRECL